MDRREIARQRLRNQRVSSVPLGTPEEVVRWLGAVQAQEYAVAKWSIGQRTEGADEAALDRALADGVILRTHVLRPTWHFVLPADIRWLIGLTGPRVQALNAYWYRKLDLDDAVFTRANALMATALEGGNQLTRKELSALLAGHGIVADGLRLGYLLMRAELDLVLASGGLKGRQHTYALLDERAPQAAPLDRDEALAELTTRYFTSRGPATQKDYVWWSSLTAADAKRGLELAGSQLEWTVVADRTYWSAASPPPPGPDPVSPTAHLLQSYDEYVVAYSESKDVFDIAGLAGAVPGDQAMFNHAILMDGQVIGHWRRRQRPRTAGVDVQLARPLDDAEQDALDDAVQRYGTFVGRPGTWR